MFSSTPFHLSYRLLKNFAISDIPAKIYLITPPSSHIEIFYNQLDG